MSGRGGDVAPETLRGGRRIWVALLIALVVCGMVAGGAYAWRRARRGPAIPEVALNLSGYDPEIVAAVERASGEVKREPRSAPAWGNLGSILMTHRFHQEALACLVEAEKLAPQEPRWPYLQAIVLLWSNPDAALPKVARAAELAGDSTPVVRLRLANLLIERGELQEAEKHLRAVMAQGADDPHAQLGMGKIELARERLPEALAFLERATTSPQTARAATALIATIQQRLGNAAAAEEASRRAVALPRDVAMPDAFGADASELHTGLQAWLAQANRLLKSGKLLDALDLHEKAVANYPHSALAWQLLGHAQVEARNYAAAEKSLQKAIELAPEWSQSHFQLGSIYYAQRQRQKAAECFRRATELRPSYAVAHHNLGICLTTLDRRAEAIEAFRAAIRHDPRHADAHRWLGETLMREDRAQEAIEPLSRAVELNPRDQAAAELLDRARARSAEAP